MGWHRLDAEKTNALLDKIKSSGEAILFSQKNNEAKCMRLPFCRDVLLYRIENTATLPIFSMDFLGFDGDFFYLDGTDNALKSISKKGQLSLRDDNIAAFVQFYFFNVVQEEGEIYPLLDPYPLPDIADQNIHVSQQEIPEGAPSFDFTTEADGFSVTTPLFYSGTLMVGEVKVSMDGDVKISSVTPMLGQGADSSLSDART